MEQIGVVAILLGVVVAVVVLWQRSIHTKQRLADVEYGLRSVRTHLIHTARKGEPYQLRPLLYEPDPANKELR